MSQIGEGLRYPSGHHTRLDASEALISHATHPNASLTVGGRRKLLELVIRDGWVQARVAERLQISRAAVSKWVRRYRTDGLAGLGDHSSRPRPRPSPGQTSQRTERRIIVMRFTRRWGPHRIGYYLRLPQSTVSAGDLVHIDVKKLGRIPDGGGGAPTGTPLGG